MSVTHGNPSAWAREALASGEITPDQFEQCVEKGARIVEFLKGKGAPTTPTQPGGWRPAPEGPPDSHGVSRYTDLRHWCKDNQGVWATITCVHPNVAQHLKRDGFEAMCRNTRVDDGIRHADVWVRWNPDPS